MAGKGLGGVVAARTAISHVYGEEGRLIYGGYDIADLAEDASFEEVSHLLWYGELPGKTQLDELRAKLERAAPVDPRVIDLLRQGGPEDHPMALLRTAVSALSLIDPDA